MNFFKIKSVNIDEKFKIIRIISDYYEFSLINAKAFYESYIIVDLFISESLFIDLNKYIEVENTENISEKEIELQQKKLKAENWLNSLNEEEREYFDFLTTYGLTAI